MAINSCIPVLISILAGLAIPSDCSHFDHTAPKSLSSSSRSQANVVAFFVFGDSYFDPGNNNYNVNTTSQAKFPPYGETFFKHPTGRFCDGRIFPDFIAEYAKLPLIPPFLGDTDRNQLPHYGLNFASGGAGALDQTFQGKVISLKTQLQFFKNAVKKLRLNLGKKEAKLLVSNAVYLFNIGANDYVFPLSTNSTLLSSHTSQEYASMVVGNFTEVIQGIYKEGGRKFGVLNLGPLGCSPALRAANLSIGGGGGCLEVANAFAQLHNTLLSQKFRDLHKNLDGFKYSYFDFFNVACQILANPLQYGFKEVKSACCGSGPFRGEFSCGVLNGEIKEFQLCDDPRDHVFFDADHPSEAANWQISEVMWAGPPNLIGPYNLQSLFQLAL